MLHGCQYYNWRRKKRGARWCAPFLLGTWGEEILPDITLWVYLDVAAARVSVFDDADLGGDAFAHGVGV